MTEQQREAMEAERDGMKIKPTFGDIIENDWASTDNPHRVGIFIRNGRRKGIVNPGTYFLLTDGKGDFWETPYNSEHKLKIVGSVFPANQTAVDAERNRIIAGIEAKRLPDVEGELFDGTYNAGLDAAIAVAEEDDGEHTTTE